MNGKNLLFNIINSAGSVFCGGLIYLFTRRNTYINIIEVPLLGRNAITDFFSFYVADALWAYGLFFALASFLKEKISFCFSLGAGILWELAQLTDTVSGTFDVLDIIMYLMANIIAMIILKKRRKENEQHI